MVLDQQELSEKLIEEFGRQILVPGINEQGQLNICLLYTSPSPRDPTKSRMPSSA